VCTDCQPGYFLRNKKCRPCKSPCATCSGSRGKCLTCETGYNLDGVKCKSENTISFRLRIDIPLEDFYSTDAYEKIIAALLQIIQNSFYPNQTDTDFLFMDGIESGSTVISGSVAQPAGNSDTSSTQALYTDAFNTGGSIGGYSLLESSFTGSTITTTDSGTTEEQN